MNDDSQTIPQCPRKWIHWADRAARKNPFFGSSDRIQSARIE